jgi:hypothetical protein
MTDVPATISHTRTDPSVLVVRANLTIDGSAPVLVITEGKPMELTAAVWPRSRMG